MIFLTLFHNLWFKGQFEWCFFYLAIIKGPPNGNYFIIEGPCLYYFTEKVSQALQPYQHITLAPVAIPDENRINVKLCGEQEFDINSPGPSILGHYQAKMLELIQSKLSKNDWMIVSGSFAPGMNSDFLLKLSEIVHSKKAYLVLDIPNLYADLLIQAKPFLNGWYTGWRRIELSKEVGCCKQQLIFYLVNISLIKTV